ncbi:GTP cyclohydrolase II [Virgibacillus xinjiangensis]|uniref:GTP cyclohydrolase II n=1 Tax=Virgibacillus xinjiangensis TaxID=393090 RepID=A0ABV7CTV4_9BACI
MREKTVFFKWFVWLDSKVLGGKELNIDQIVRKDLNEFQHSSVLVYGDLNDENITPFIRLHSICQTGDIFGSKKCDCGRQFEKSLELILDNGSGALFYLTDHEGRGIGLFNKALTYLLQQDGLDTVEANLELGLDVDRRQYGEAINILGYLTNRPINLITNNPLKISSLLESQLDIKEIIPLWTEASEHNAYYVQTKIEKTGHLI